MSHASESFKALNIAVLTVSDTRNFDTDTSGRYLTEALQASGHHLADWQICSDDIYLIRALVSQWIVDPSVSAVLITGGTGFYDRDVTPEAVKVLFDKEVDGFGEVFRAISLNEIGMSTIQSRAIAGLANYTGIFCLPGSTGACRTAWTNILEAQFNSTTRPCNFVTHFKGGRK